MRADRIFVIAHDGGSEGYSPPVQAFLHEDEAFAAAALSGETYSVFSVPIWPVRAEKPWHAIQPLPIGGSAHSPKPKLPGPG